jgi:hypothetical protein
MKKIGKKYTYFYTILSAIPFGIGMLVTAFTLFREIPKTELIYFHGPIVEWGNTVILNGKYNDRLPVLFIRLSDKEFYSAVFRDIDILKAYMPAAKKQQWTITIGTKKDSHYIEQFAIGDKIILKYKPPYWQAWTFLIVGLVFSVMGSIYLVKYHKDTWS